jgi:predicted nucleotidyltransferase
MAETDLPEIFKTKERMRILDYVSKRDHVTATGVVSGTGASKALVSRYLRLLVRAGLLGKEDRTYRWKQSARSAAIKRLLNIELLTGAIELPDWADGIGVFGSFAEGTNTIESDIDLWVLLPAISMESELRTAELEQQIRTRTGQETHVLILTREKVAHLRENDLPFYTGLTTTSVTIRGESPVSP